MDNLSVAGLPAHRSDERATDTLSELENNTRTTVETLWDRDGETAYQTRVKCGGFRIHIFWRGDRDPDMHDHPADFWTFPLVSYVEEVPHRWSRGHTERRVVRAFRLHRRKAPYPHLVLGRWTGAMQHFTPGRPEPAYEAGPIVTLGWWSNKRRDWGFHTVNGWVPWKAYVSAPGWDKDGTARPTVTDPGNASNPLQPKDKP